MLAYTLLLVACVVAGCIAYKPTHGIRYAGLQRGNNLSYRRVAIAPRQSVRGYQRISYPRGAHHRRTSSYIPASKYGNYNSGIGTYDSSMYQSDPSGFLGNTGGLTSFSAPTIGASSLGGIIGSNIYSTGAALPTFNIAVGGAGSAYNDDASSSLYLLNNPRIGTSSYRRRFPTSKKAGISGSY